MTAVQGDGSTAGTTLKAHDGSSSSTAGDGVTNCTGTTKEPLGTEYGYVWRFKRATGSAEYEITSNFFKTMALRKIHDQHIQFKPYLLTKIVTTTGASSSQSTTTNRGEPGSKEIDMYFMPTAVGSYTLDFKLGSNASTGAFSVIAE